MCSRQIYLCWREATDFPDPRVRYSMENELHSYSYVLQSTVGNQIQDFSVVESVNPEVQETFWVSRHKIFESSKSLNFHLTVA